MKAKKPKPRNNTAKFNNKKLQPYNHGLHLSHRTVDKRSRIGRAYTVICEILQEFCGEDVRAQLLIPSVAWKAIRLFEYESMNIKIPVPDISPKYFSLVNAYRKDLAALATFAQHPKAPDLDSYLKEAYEKPTDDN